MAVGLANSGRHAADEEARAEVDVLNSRLEKTSQLTKKIQACLGRLEETGKSVREVAGPLNGETKRLQVLGNSLCHQIGMHGLFDQTDTRDLQISSLSYRRSSAYGSQPTARMMRSRLFEWAQRRPVSTTT